MSGVVRLTLVSHAMTDAVAAARFPDDEPLNSLGRRQAQAAASQLDRAGDQVRAPERRAGQTATLLGLDAATEPLLADLDCGRWRGHALDALPAGDVTVWLTEPAATPHGGESIVELIERVTTWLGSLSPTGSAVVAVTHPAVIRAAIVVALDAPPRSFWRVDVAPAGRTGLHRRGGRWTLRL